MDAKIKSPNYTSWGNSNDTVKQPAGISYDQLHNKLAEVEKPKFNDLRKSISKESKDKHTQVDESVEKIDTKSIIPVPGLMVEHENSESEWQPSSEWQAPKGVVWGH